MSRPASILEYQHWRFGFVFGVLEATVDPATGRETRHLQRRRWPSLRVERGPAGEAEAERFVRGLQQQQSRGELDCVSQSIEQLDETIANLQRRVDQLQELIRFARRVRESHEPAADRRRDGQ